MNKNVAATNIKMFCWIRNVWGIRCVIVQRFKVSVAILTDLNLLPYQTAIMQWRNFNKDISTNYNWILLLKIKHNYDRAGLELGKLGNKTTQNNILRFRDFRDFRVFDLSLFHFLSYFFFLFFKCFFRIFILHLYLQFYTL